MKKTNNWQWWFHPCTRSYRRFDGQGWHLFDAGIIKIHTIPDEGYTLQRKHYYGFFIKFSYWFPIDKAE